MPGSHDLSVENLRLHEHIVDSERHTSQQQHMVKTATSAPTAARTAARAHSVRPPAKPDTVISSHHSKPPASKAASKAGSMHETSRHHREMLTVTVIEEAEEEEEDALPPAAPASSKHSSKKAVVPAAEEKHHHSNHHHHHSYYDHGNTKDMFNLPAGIPPPPGFSKMIDFPSIPKMTRTSDNEARYTEQQQEQTALMRLPPPPPARSVASGSSSSKQVVQQQQQHQTRFHTISASHDNKRSGKERLATYDEGKGQGDNDLVDVMVEEVRQVTRRRFVVKVPRDRIAEWGGLKR